jgi:hypothetical protein
LKNFNKLLEDEFLENQGEDVIKKAQKGSGQNRDNDNHRGKNERQLASWPGNMFEFSARILDVID